VFRSSSTQPAETSIASYPAYDAQTEDQRRVTQLLDKRNRESESSKRAVIDRGNPRRAAGLMPRISSRSAPVDNDLHRGYESAHRSDIWSA
jgi:hypothetical protein